MRKNTRDRLVLPFLLPVGILLVIVGALYGFSRILLSVRSSAATATALLVALGILVTATVVSARGPVRVSGVAAMIGAVAGVAMLAGGLALAVAGPEEEGGGAEAPATVVALVASQISFDQTKLAVPAGEPFRIAFDNQDAGIQHNVVIYDNADHTGDPLFRGELVTGVAKANYDVQALDAGTYYFVCQIHPVMTGEIDAAAGGGAAGGLTLAAQNLSFDTAKIELVAGAATTLTFENKDAGVQHNLAIYSDDPTQVPNAEVLFQGEWVTGPATVEYRIPPLQAGTYFFRCDVHPSMKGTVEVKQSGGPPAPTATATAPTPTGGPIGGGATVTVTAQGLRFDTDTIDLSAGEPSAIHFVNQDAGTQHDIAISTANPAEDPSAQQLFQGDLVTGPAEVDYQVPALDAGTYYFFCVVHATMNGSVVVA